MLQIVLKKHNLDLAVKSNIALTSDLGSMPPTLSTMLSMLSTLSMPSTQNFILITSTLNFSADNFEHTDTNINTILEKKKLYHWTNYLIVVTQKLYTQQSIKTVSSRC